MYRGTTPTFTFTLPIECETISKLSVAFKQGGELLFERGLPDVTMSGNVLSCTLFQFTPLREGRQQKGTKKENDYCTFCRKKRKVYLIIKRIRKNHQNPTAHIVQKFTPTLRRHAG